MDDQQVDYIAVRLKGHRVAHASMSELQHLVEDIISMYERLNQEADLDHYLTDGMWWE